MIKYKDVAEGKHDKIKNEAISIIIEIFFYNINHVLPDASLFPPVDQCVRSYPTRTKTQQQPHEFISNFLGLLSPPINSPQTYSDNQRLGRILRSCSSKLIVQETFEQIPRAVHFVDERNPREKEKEETKITEMLLPLITAVR